MKQIMYCDEQITYAKFYDAPIKAYKSYFVRRIFKPREKLSFCRRD